MFLNNLKFILGALPDALSPGYVTARTTFCVQTFIPVLLIVFSSPCTSDDSIVAAGEKRK
jgi:hypothetical protein